ncbi:pantothenate kinase [Microcystis aeruginosa CS-555/01A07]|uniref:pantothenate kinase n=1 Tax=Microcystis aeruginosa TaxID=1126 RepID=UPI00232E4FE2|nr:pantothenate kinase [Microcystis aeruginosa]MDB9428677.1 pantothenate kinase [Microcystis aeruginosa CS-555/01A07]
MTEQDNDWIGLIIGNSRLHWGYFRGQTLLACLDTPHLREPPSNEFLQQIFPKLLTNKCNCELIVASVVPSQKELWANYGNLRIITLKDIPLLDLYPTFGIDRALAVLGAGKKYGFPCLVIDAGTALTFTGVDRDKKLVGGAILPGLKVQLASLRERTAALPEVSLPERLPQMWAKETAEGIRSGIIYTILAGIEKFTQEWLNLYPESRIILTGGDGDLIRDYCQENAIKSLLVDETIIFQGIAAVKGISSGLIDKGEPI